MVTNPINISGQEYELLTERVLSSSGHSFKKQHSGIDFVVNFNDRSIGLEVKAQSVGGSVDEKLMYTVYKYSKKYDEIIFLFNSNFKLNKSIRNAMEFTAENMNTKLIFLWGLDSLRDYLSNKEKVTNAFF